MRPAELIDTAVRGHLEVLNAVNRFDHSDTLAASLLPGWSRARVIAHLAHKSNSHVNVFEGARLGQ